MSSKRWIVALPLALMTLGCTLAGSASQVVITPLPILSETLQPATATPTPAPTETPTPTRQSSSNVVAAPVVVGCTPRYDWPLYTVVAGDTLASIARRVGSTVAALAQASCLANPNVIVVGQKLRVPRLPYPPTPVPLPIYNFVGLPPFDVCAVQHPGGPSPVYISNAPDGKWIGILGNWAIRLRESGGWYEIDLQNGRTGWVHSSAVKLIGLCTPPPLPVYNFPDLPPFDSCFVQRLPSGPDVLIASAPGGKWIGILGNWAVRLRDYEGWHQIDLRNGQTGWVHSSTVSLNGQCFPQPPTKVPPTPTPSLKLIVSPGDPPFDACVVAHPGGSDGPVYIVASPENPYPIAMLGNWLIHLRTSGGWYEVALPDGSTAWISANTVNLVGQCHKPA